MNKPDNQLLMQLSLNPLLTTINESVTGYGVNYTARRTGVVLGGTYYPDKVAINASGTQIQTGYRVDLSDAIDVFKIGDTINIGNTNYAVKRIVYPDIDKTTGKVVSFQNIETSPVEVYPSTKRSYRFDISININDLPT